MNKYNENNERHGHWEVNYHNGQLGYKGNYINRNQIGFWINQYITEFHL